MKIIEYSFFLSYFLSLAFSLIFLFNIVWTQFLIVNKFSSNFYVARTILFDNRCSLPYRLKIHKYLIMSPERLECSFSAIAVVSVSKMYSSRPIGLSIPAGVPRGIAFIIHRPPPPAGKLGDLIDIEAERRNATPV